MYERIKALFLKTWQQNSKTFIKLLVLCFLVVGRPADAVLPHYPGTSVPEGLFPKATVHLVLSWLVACPFIPVAAGPTKYVLNLLQLHPHIIE